MQSAEKIQLAHAPAFELGRLAVAPARRELVRDDGERAILEHRVMQVLIALARADGAIVTRDELVVQCWDGRIVGEDAINRVISRLRKVADGIGAGSFAIETITKVGYRLVPTDPATASAATGAPAFFAREPKRRRIIAAGLAGVLAVAGTGTWAWRRFGERDSVEVDALLEQAWQAWAQGTREGNSQAIGLYRRAIDMAPRHADAWGYLAGAYADRSHAWSGPTERVVLRERARVAGRRALAIDPDNGLGHAAIAYARPGMGHWQIMETTFRRGLRNEPGQWLLAYCLGLLLTRVGRHSEAAAQFATLRKRAPAATQYLFHIQALWGAGRLDEAEKLLEEATAIYATHRGIWFTRFNMLVDAGRTNMAIGLALDAEGRPGDMTAAEIERLLATADAQATRDPGRVAAVMADHLRLARTDARQAATAITIASALGRLDDAFALADGYFFSRGLVIPDEAAEAGRSATVSLDERETRFLFLPPTTAMRADPRFDWLVGELGLDRYWRTARATPDYRRA